MTDDGRPQLAVIGGSGFYTFLDGAEDVEVTTPFGDPSAPVAVGTVDTDAGPRRVAFLPRHGRDHQFPAHRVNYRANLWALRSLGVRWILAPCAVGGLQAEHGPGTLVVPDQLVDRTTGRTQTFYDTGANHVSFGDPYSPALRGALLDGLRAAGQEPVDGGTMVVIEGPRFSTRAESQWYARQGWDVVNMTGHPEAVLARELAMAYATVALVTDHDAGVETGTSVNQDDVFAVFARYTDLLRDTLRGVAATVDVDGDDPAFSALDGLHLPFELP
ncbi:MAG: S-methyl-5'-thioadenosine phosphorylase [Nocardioidaceae bacterium]|nr:S-methyl-5'-thioadenosine phosphorylase [Nocardioidaceae bacterium]